MTCNLGNTDRLLRLVLGVGFFLLPFASGWEIWSLEPLKYGAAAIGGVLALTSSFRFCPVYRILGLSTCRP